MAKNVIGGNKKIVLEDQLYNEILNGFRNLDITEDEKDKRSERLNYKQKVRVQRVGKEFFSSEFNKKWIDYNYDYLVKTS